jgi:site-specific DNA-methyltransferase (cytosine-N4-specific)
MGRAIEAICDIMQVDHQPQQRGKTQTEERRMSELGDGQSGVRHSDLPFGSEFSPSQVDLPFLLELAQQHAGNWKAFEDAVRQRYFDQHAGTNEYNRRKLANNTKLGMIAYGIYDRATSTLTDFGKELSNVRDDEAALYRRLAGHILLNLHGAVFIQCIQDIQASGETVNLVKLREWLDERGVHFPRGGKHPSMMKLWLEKAGVMTGWRVNEDRLAAILGRSVAEIEALTRLTVPQRAFVRALANLGGSGPFASNAVEKLAAATYGVTFNEKSLPKDVLYPLEAAGYIRLERGTKEQGRGAKPFSVYPTDKLDKGIVEPLLAQSESMVGSDLRLMVRKPLVEILAELKAEDRLVRGLALEALAFKLMRLIDLTYVGTRLRGDETGGAEVDVVFESDRLVFSRWQVQCKNTARVNLEDVAKEVGLTHLLKSNVVVMVSTGEIGSEARRFANVVMQDSHLCIVMVDRNDMDVIVRDPTSIVEVFNREARQTMKIKKVDVRQIKLGTSQA